jgi:hypothetical protein
MNTPTRRVPTVEPKPRRRWKRWLGALGLLLLMGGLVWAVRRDPHLSRVEELQKELAENKNLSPDERKARFTELRENMKQLTDDQKWELSAPMRARQKAEMDRYFAMSAKEKTTYLDEKINQSEKMRKQFESKGGKAGSGGPGGFNAGGFGGNKGNGPGGGGRGPGAGNGGPSGGQKQRSPEEIEKRRRGMLDRTSPEERAQHDAFRKEMNDRRRQRGLPAR